MQTDYRDILFATVYFLLSILITGWFIEQKFFAFITPPAIIISNLIAASKWIIQIIAAIMILKTEKWAFIRRMAAACLISACMLFAWYILRLFPLEAWLQFKYTLALAALAMIVLYYKAVVDTGLSVRWYFAWLVTLVIAIFLQIQVVFP